MTIASPTIELLRVIGSPFGDFGTTEDPAESEELYYYAFKNRVGLLYLEALKRRSKLSKLRSEYEELDYRARETLVTAARVATVLNQAHIPYVLFKTLRPYPATPNDVDVVFLGPDSEFGSIKRALMDAGYLQEEEHPGPLQVLFFDPRRGGDVHWDKHGGIYYVDVYETVAADYFVYLSKKELQGNVISVQIAHPASEVSVLCPELELAAILMHSVFPTKTYALEIFYTTCFYFARFEEQEIERFISFTKRNHFVLPVRSSLSITAALHHEAFGRVPSRLSDVLQRLGGEHKGESESLRENDFRVPHKHGFDTFFGSFLAKLVEPSSLASLAVQAWHMLEPKFARDVFVSLWKRWKNEEIYEQV